MDDPIKPRFPEKELPAAPDNPATHTEKDIEDAIRLWRQATGQEIYAGAVLPIARVLALYAKELARPLTDIPALRVTTYPFRLNGKWFESSKQLMKGSAIRHMARNLVGFVAGSELGMDLRHSFTGRLISPDDNVNLGESPEFFLEYKRKTT